MKSAFLIGLLLIGNVLPLLAEEILLDLHTKKNQEALLTVTLLTCNKAEIFRSLDKGLEVEIFFQICLYEKVPALLSILGDKLIIEKKPSYIAYKNLFENLYMIKVEEQLYTYSDKEEFLRDFVTLNNLVFDTQELDPRKDYYIRARVHLNHVKLDPPLNLIALIYPVGFITQWHEHPLAIK